MGPMGSARLYAQSDRHAIRTHTVLPHAGQTVQSQYEVPVLSPLCTKGQKVKGTKLYVKLKNKRNEKNAFAHQRRRMSLLGM
jgi:hypothetical protein